MNRPRLAFTDPDYWLDGIEDTYGWLRANEPVAWAEDGQFHVLAKHADVLRVSRENTIFRSGRGVLVRDEMRRGTMPGAPSIIYMDPPQHARHRRIVSRGFTPRMVAELEPRVRQTVRATLAAIPANEEVDFVDLLAAPVPIAVIAQMLGVPESDWGPFRRWSDALIEGADTGASETSMASVAELWAYFSTQITARREHPLEDVLSALACAEIDGEHLTNDELVIFILTLLVAGNETTRSLLSGSARAFAEHPLQWSRLREDRTLIPGAVEECLRWTTPIKNFARTATRDTEIHGVPIPEGGYVVMLYASANRDEEAFGATANCFDIGRLTEPGHLAFGFGEHVCLGGSLARMETRVVFEEMLARFASMELAAEPERIASTLVNGMVRLPLILRES